MDPSEIKRIDREHLDAVLKTNDDAMTVTAVVSHESVDRDGEVIVVGGIDLSMYRKNPVLLWFHGRSAAPPVGKAQWIKRDREAETLVAKFQFANTELGREIFGLYSERILNAFSVGVNPWFAQESKRDFGEPTPAELKKYGAGCKRVYRKCDLLEVSAVPVGANPQALQMAVAGGILKSAAIIGDLRPLLDQAPAPESPTQSHANAPNVVVRRLGFAEPEPDPDEGLVIRRCGCDLDFLVRRGVQISRGAVIKVKTGQ